MQITPTGNLYAENGYFRGSVSAGRIDYGGDDGYFNGGGITSGSISGGYGGQIYGGSIGNYAVSGGINTSLGYADFANGVFNGWNTASNLSTEDKGLVIGGHTIAIASTSFRDGNGSTISLQYLTWI